MRSRIKATAIVRKLKAVQVMACARPPTLASRIVMLDWFTMLVVAFPATWNQTAPIVQKNQPRKTQVIPTVWMIDLVEVVPLGQREHKKPTTLKNRANIRITGLTISLENMPASTTGSRMAIASFLPSSVLLEEP